MKSEVYLLSKKLQCFSNNDLLSFITPDKMQDILLKDKRPYFQAYSIAHEGKSRPTVLGVGGKLINWSKNAVKSIRNAVKTGIKFFYRHNKDNSTNGREELGEVVGYTEKEIDGKLNSIVIGYFPENKKELAQKLDICSHEGEWNFIESGDNLEADTCDKITGVALSSSDIEQPAFSGARQLAMVQCFEDNTTGNVDKIKEVKPMTFTELKQACIELNVWPSQLFDLDKIKQDKQFSKIFEDNDGQIKTISQELEKLKNDNKLLNDTVESKQKEVLSLTVKDRFDKISKDNQLNMTDKEKTFISESLNGIDDLTDEGVKNFIVKRQSDYRLFQKVNGIDNNLDNQNSQQTGKPKESNEIDFTDPIKNDYI